MDGIIHHDDWLIVLDKPSGLLSVPGIGPDNQDCLARRAAACCPGARIVHRLDQATSGVIVLALDAETHRLLSRLFEDRLVEKHYVAVVDGVVRDDAGEIDLPLRKDMDPPRPGPRHIVDLVRGKPAQTSWRVERRYADRTRLLLTPHTGRSHQLRIHLNEIGHPILGDDLYAPTAVVARAERLLLHAASLAFVHPVTRQRLVFETPVPF